MIRTRSPFRRTTVLAAASAAALVLAACGGHGDTGDSSAAHGGHPSHTASPAASAAASQDSTTRPTSPSPRGWSRTTARPWRWPTSRRAGSVGRVKKLAADIKKAQDPEIEKLSGWLTSWGEDVPAAGAMDPPCTAVHPAA